MRTEGTRAGLDSGGGPAGLQSFDQRMDHKELRDTGGTLVGAEGDDNTKGSTQTYWNASRRSDKHAALQDNAADEIELSTPLGSFFTFCRHEDTYLNLKKRGWSSGPVVRRPRRIAPQPCGIALADDSTPAVSGPPPVVQGGPAWSKVVQGDP